MSIPRSLTISQKKSALPIEFYTKTVERSNQKVWANCHRANRPSGEMTRYHDEVEFPNWKKKEDKNRVTYKYPGIATDVAFCIIWSCICFPVQPN